MLPVIDILNYYFNDLKKKNLQSNSICPKITKKRFEISLYWNWKYHIGARENMNATTCRIPMIVCKVSQLGRPTLGSLISWFTYPLQGGACALFGISIMAAVARTWIRIQQNRKLAIDDAFLVLACTCLTASFALLIVFTTTLFQEEAIEPNLPQGIINFQINSSASLAPKSNLFQSFPHVDCHLLNLICLLILLPHAGETNADGEPLLEDCYRLYRTRVRLLRVRRLHLLPSLQLVGL